MLKERVCSNEQECCAITFKREMILIKLLSLVILFCLFFVIR